MKKFSDKTIITGDTLILNAAHNADYVGSKIYRAENDVEGALATGEWTLVRSNKSVLDSQYLYYWLLSGQTRHHIRQIVKGIHLYPKDVSRLKIPLPPLEEQKRIAAILDKADAIRRKRKEAIQLTEELLRSTFLDMFGDPVGRNKQWKRHNLSDFVSVVSGQVDPQTEPYIDMPHIGGDNIESNTGFIHKVQTPRELKLISEKYLFEPTDILYSKIRPYLNKVSIPGFVGIYPTKK